jgi:cell division transport system permease protein
MGPGPHPGRPPETTGRPPHPQAAGAGSARGFDLRAPARKVRSDDSAAAPIIPAGSVTGRSLTLVITIMCFLASLTAGAVYMVNQQASAWLRNIASEVSVQVRPGEPEATDRFVTEVSLYLAKQPGILKVRPYTAEQSAELLEPWLGQTSVLEQLPIPRIIALELDRGEPPDLAGLSAAISQRFEGVTLDDHRHWQVQIRTVTRSLALGGVAILVLVAAATAAIIISATKSSMASNREIVEVLHFVGATDRFIAREFEKHFLILGIKAGLVGAVCAMAVFVLMPIVMPVLGGGALTEAELRNLIGGGSLDLAGYILLGFVVFAIAGMCMLTSRYGVFRILHQRS